MILAKGIENIVGSKVMEEKYFNADLEGLIEELSKYDLRENIVKLLFLIDRYTSRISSFKDYEELLRSISRLNYVKLLDDYLNGVITRCEFEVEYVLKVLEYREGNLYSEGARVVLEEESFFLEEEGFISPIYVRDKVFEKIKKYEKKL